MTTVTYTTCYSTYEVDEDNMRVRRTLGINPPTSRQGEDGEWQSCWRVEVLPDGRLLIHWNNEGRCTVTSPVVAFEEMS